MIIDKLKRDLKQLREKTAELIVPGFTYYEQELIRRVLKATLAQMKTSSDISTTKGILRKTEWLDE